MRPKEVAPTFTMVRGLIWPVPLTEETRSARTAFEVATAGTSERLCSTVPTTTPATTSRMRTKSRIFLPVIDAFFRRFLERFLSMFLRGFLRRFFLRRELGASRHTFAL